MIEMIKNSFHRNNWVYKQLKCDKFLIIIGQYIPLMNTIFFPISFILSHCNYSNIFSKINLLLNLTFVGISILIPFLLLAYFEMIKKKRLSNIKIKKTQLET